GPEGTGGLFAFWNSSGPERTTFSRRSNGVHPRSYAARVKASPQRTLFDFLAVPEERPPSAVPVAPVTAEAINKADPPASPVKLPSANSRAAIASGEKTKARDILA